MAPAEGPSPSRPRVTVYLLYRGANEPILFTNKRIAQLTRNDWRKDGSHVRLDVYTLSGELK